VDVLVRGGTVYDGSGGPARRVDLGIRGDRIVFIGDAAQAGIASKQTIDATNLVVSPRFIDPHTHSYEGLPNLHEERRKNPGALMQGVTTVVTGADGRGPLDVARVLTEAERLGLGTNTYALAGFGTTRSRVMGNSSGGGHRGAHGRQALRRRLRDPPARREVLHDRSAQFRARGHPHRPRNRPHWSG
jgi:dihydroorotase-like cyclic amidohydrolase